VIVRLVIAAALVVLAVELGILAWAVVTLLAS